MESKKLFRSEINDFHLYFIAALLTAAAALYCSGLRSTVSEDGGYMPFSSCIKTAAAEAGGYSKLDAKTEEEIFAGPAVEDIKLPEAPGVYVSSNQAGAIDYSNAAKGYVMLKYAGGSEKKKIVRITAPQGQNYDYITYESGVFRPYPLSAGSGTYKITLYEQVGGKKYTPLHSAAVAVELENEFTPFLYPNYFVNYGANTKAVKLAAYLAVSEESALGKITVIYDYVIKSLSYNYALADEVTAGYVPDLDTVITLKKGICFDYASLMTAMLRSVGIPSKLVFGYADGVYHAWISVYTEETGWIDGVISFDGKNWKLMDPTYASTGGGGSEVMDFIENPSHYTELYRY